MRRVNHTKKIEASPILDITTTTCFWPTAPSKLKARPSRQPGQRADLYQPATNVPTQ
jgi:hypothetical protein